MHNLDRSILRWQPGVGAKSEGLNLVGLEKALKSGEYRAIEVIHV
ncbi:hypothetical protein RSSM_06495 [Rhodopirellula sallentina SM41]|uniref:Uncharacterized protein n=1 Tax=Rhodopirellula sallentina SM41 TaxID=1263870 RepID=M5U7Z0_9BACT|nr:hypothetical protein RSSM_06495 [Rhodopirellula sallentina SM41]